MVHTTVHAATINVMSRRQNHMVNKWGISATQTQELDRGFGHFERILA